MDRSLGTTAAPRIKDVTQQILDSHLIYGSSDNTNPAYASSNRSLNYHEGGSIHRPQLDRVSVIPFSLNYSDAVGLHGKENHFVRVNVNIDNRFALSCFEEPGWRCAAITGINGEISTTTNHYKSRTIFYRIRCLVNQQNCSY